MLYEIETISQLFGPLNVYPVTSPNTRRRGPEYIRNQKEQQKITEKLDTPHTSSACANALAYVVHVCMYIAGTQRMGL